MLAQKVAPMAAQNDACMMNVRGITAESVKALIECHDLICGLNTSIGCSEPPSAPQQSIEKCPGLTTDLYNLRDGAIHLRNRLENLLNHVGRP